MFPAFAVIFMIQAMARQGIRARKTTTYITEPAV